MARLSVNHLDGGARSAQVEILNVSSSIVAEVLLGDLVPSAFPGFETAMNRRTIRLHVGGFPIQ